VFVVLEAVELAVVAVMVAVGFWLIDLIQRKTGHPVHDDIPDEP